MALVEIEVVSLEPLQRASQVSICVLGQSLTGLARQKHLITMRTKRRPQALFGVP
jgi:hypothetical protein